MLNLDAKRTVHVLIQMIESQEPSQAISEAIELLVQELGGIPALMRSMTVEGRLMYLMLLLVRNG